MRDLADNKLYRGMFKELLLQHAQACTTPKRRRAKWCAWWPAVGQQYAQGRLLIVGRALNGWDETKFSVDIVENAAGLERLVDRCVRSASSAISWARRAWDSGRGYQIRRSAFWRMVNHLIEQAGLVGPEQICWSNLMRVSPGERGNTPEWSYRAQLPMAARLLEREVELLKPAVIVALTGESWFKPFIKHLAHGIELSKPRNAKYVCLHGRIRDSAIIVAEHPQTRPADKMMQEIKSVWPG